MKYLSFLRYYLCDVVELHIAVFTVTLHRSESPARIDLLGRGHFEEFLLDVLKLFLLLCPARVK